MVFSKGLTERFLPVLQLTGLHEYYVDTDLIRLMLDEAGCPTEQETMDCCYRILENAGFCTQIGHNIYRLHPALRGYLLRQTPAGVSLQKGFVDIMGTFANSLLSRPLHEVRDFYQMNIANFYHARQLAKIQKMDMDDMALTQSLAYYAENMRRLDAAVRLYMELAEKAKLCDRRDFEAGAFHQLGVVAQEQRDFEAAEGWYKRALEIAEKQGNEHGMAGTYHQLGVTAKEQQNFTHAADFYLKSLNMFADTNDPHHLQIVIKNYVTLLHDAPDTERGQLRKMWSMRAGREFTEILEKREEELYGTSR